MSPEADNTRSRTKALFEEMFSAYINVAKDLTPTSMHIRKLKSLAKENELYDRIQIDDTGKVSIDMREVNIEEIVPVLCSAFDALIEFAEFILGAEEAVTQAEECITPILERYGILPYEIGVMERILRGRYGARVPTGVPGLDYHLGGGYPKGRSVLLEGPTSNEREKFAYQFVKEGLSRRASVLVLLSHESPKDFRKKMTAMGVRTSDYERRGYLAIIDWYSYRERTVAGVEEDGAITAASRDLTDLDMALGRAIRRMAAGVQRYALIDMISAALNLYDSKKVYDFTLSLKTRLEKDGFTSLFVLEKGAHDRKTVSAIYQTMAGILDLHRELVEDQISATLAVRMMMGAKYEEKPLPLFLSQKGVYVLEKGLDREKILAEFTNLPGIGPAKARALLEQGFTSLADLSAASLTELCEVPGITLRLARNIKEYLLARPFEEELIPPEKEGAVCTSCGARLKPHMTACPICGERVAPLEVVTEKVEMEISELDEDISALLEELEAEEEIRSTLVDVEGIEKEARRALDELVKEIPEVEELPEEAPPPPEWIEKEIRELLKLGIEEETKIVAPRKLEEEVELALEEMVEEIPEMKELPEEVAPPPELPAPIVVDTVDIGREAKTALDEVIRGLPEIRDLLVEYPKCPRCGASIKEDQAVCFSCYSFLVDPKELVARGYTSTKTKGRFVGMVNTEGRINGLINGVRPLKGRINGVVNGKPHISGRIRGKPFEGKINGIINGVGRINGLVNDQGHINGLINGSGRVNGLVNGAMYRHIPRGLEIWRARRARAHQTRRMATIGLVALTLIFLTAFVTLMPFSDLFPQKMPALPIAIDGNFSDWHRDILFPSASTPMINQNIDIVSTATEDNGGRYLAIYVEVAGAILSGEPVDAEGLVDKVRAFIDADGSMSTGYEIEGMGAEHIIEISGWRQEVSSAALFRHGGDGWDWNCFSMQGSVSARLSGSRLETQVDWSVLGNASAPRVLVSTQSWEGGYDCADFVTSSGRGALRVVQECVGDVVSGANARLTRLEVVAGHGGASINGLRMQLNGSAASPSLIRLVRSDGTEIASASPFGREVELSFPAITIPEGEVQTLYLEANVQSLAAGSTLSLMLHSPEDILTEAPVRLVTAARRFAYISSSPTAPVVDGGFAEWDAVHEDEAGDAPASADIVRYGAISSGAALHLYTEVSGAILSGAAIPLKIMERVTGPTPPPNITVGDSDRDTVPDDVDPMPYDFNNDGIADEESFVEIDGMLYQDIDMDGAPDYPRVSMNGSTDMWLNTTLPLNLTGMFVSVYIGPVERPINTGEDTIRFYIDEDNSTATGYSFSAMGADYLLEFKGKYGRVRNASLMRFTGAHPGEWKWALEGTNLTYALDTSALEVVVPVEAREGMVAVEIMNWAGELDAVNQMRVHPWTTTRALDHEWNEDSGGEGEIPSAPEFPLSIGVAGQLLMAIALILRRRALICVPHRASL
ncbi:MAG: ATPase domain-containing protein [Candidatus Thermoplasmatota archaeon]